MIFPKITIVTAISSESGPIDVCMDSLFSMGHSLPNLSLTFVNYSGKQELSDKITQNILSRGLDQAYDAINLHTEHLEGLDAALYKGIEVSPASEMVMTLYPGIEADSKTLFLMLLEIQSSNASCVSGIYLTDNQLSSQVTFEKETSPASIRDLMYEIDRPIASVQMGCALWDMKDFNDNKNRNIVIEPSIFVRHYDVDSSFEVGSLQHREDLIAINQAVSESFEKNKSLFECDAPEHEPVSLNLYGVMSRVTNVNKLTNESADEFVRLNPKKHDLRQSIQDDLWMLFEEPTDIVEKIQKTKLQRKIIQYLMFDLK